MLSVSEFVAKFEKYSDDELHSIYLNQDSYSNEAKQAFWSVIEKKGGINAFLIAQEKKIIIDNEILRLQTEAKELGRNGIDFSFIRTLSTSEILPQEKVDEILGNVFIELTHELEDKKIKPRTILGSIFGGIIASIIGGALWGLQMIYSQRIFYLFGIALALLCYAIIKGLTRQSKNNLLVFISTAIAFILSLLIGENLYDIVGYIK
jgi:hypothetical protein